MGAFGSPFIGPAGPLPLSAEDANPPESATDASGAPPEPPELLLAAVPFEPPLLLPAPDPLPLTLPWPELLPPEPPWDFIGAAPLPVPEFAAGCVALGLGLGPKSGGLDGEEPHAARPITTATFVVFASDDIASSPSVSTESTVKPTVILNHCLRLPSAERATKAAGQIDTYELTGSAKSDNRKRHT